MSTGQNSKELTYCKKAHYRHSDNLLKIYLNLQVTYYNFMKINTVEDL